MEEIIIVLEFREEIIIVLEFTECRVSTLTRQEEHR
jgi:hypothetical protein